MNTPAPTNEFLLLIRGKPQQQTTTLSHKVMHASLNVSGARFLPSDGCGGSEATGFAGFSLSLNVPDEAAAHRAFTALADGGEVEMPVGKTFWSPGFGMVTDRFGLSWMVIVEA